MNLLKTSVIFTLCLLALLSCGIDEYSYLPQVSESNITRELTNKAFITTNSLTSISYATGYIIYYKIYIIGSEYGTIPELISNNSRISSDYNVLYPYTDPSNTSSIPSLNTFKGRGFYELELEKSNIRNTVLSTAGDSFSIQFPLTDGEKPFIDSPDNPIYRSTDGGAFNPKPTGAGYRYFFSSPEMNDYANAIPTINADVSGQNGVSEFAYALMYIVAVGTNQNKGNFSRLYGKPTFISIFKLPNIN
ncbi:hypothetical protein [Treponema sp. R6D11]